MRGGFQMFNRGFHLFDLYGIPVELNISWVFILALVTWSFATGYIPDTYGDSFGVATTWLLAFSVAILLFLSILFHELSHSIVAVRNGLPIKRITLFMFGGVAQMSREVDSAGLEFRMAAAGPLFTLVLALTLYGSAYLLSGWLFGQALLRMLANINLGVFFFNMIPGFPLDGGRILRAAIWARNRNIRKATLVASNIGKGFAWLLIIFGAFTFLAFGGSIGGLWMIFIGMFLKKAATDSYRNVVYREVLGEIRISDIMREEVITVDASMDLMTLVDEYFLKYHFGAFPVVADGILQGMVSLDAVRKRPREEWQRLTVSDVMGRDAMSCVVFENEHADRLFFLIIQKGYSLVPVARVDGRIIGMVTRRDFSDAVKVMTSLLK
ncbi:MAG: site-2 protease family protein [Candidatus Krumholzibacteria bacterium]|nr:site-2 protease family protein [Candidatus Krumholzibacteria bacterium]